MAQAKQTLIKKVNAINIFITFSKKTRSSALRGPRTAWQCLRPHCHALFTGCGNRLHEPRPQKHQYNALSCVHASGAPWAEAAWALISWRRRDQGHDNVIEPSGHPLFGGGSRAAAAAPSRLGVATVAVPVAGSCAIGASTPTALPSTSAASW